jgi:cytoskeletal protein RodZ
VTTPETGGPGEPTGQVSVSTAPPPAPRRWWSAVPHHLGRARTSTVVLALLFVGVYTLYLHVRPPDPAVAPAQESTVQTPVTRAPAETTEPTTTAPTPTTTADTATPPAGTTGEEAPAESAEPAPTTAREETTTQAPPTAAPTTTAVPTATGAPGT